jgi:hypothetical protein
MMNSEAGAVRNRRRSFAVASAVILNAVNSYGENAVFVVVVVVDDDDDDDDDDYNNGNVFHFRWMLVEE